MGHLCFWQVVQVTAALFGAHGRDSVQSLWVPELSQGPAGQVARATGAQWPRLHPFGCWDSRAWRAGEGQQASPARAVLGAWPPRASSASSLFPCACLPPVRVSRPGSGRRLGVVGAEDCSCVPHCLPGTQAGSGARAPNQSTGRREPWGLRCQHPSFALTLPWTGTCHCPMTLLSLLGTLILLPAPYPLPQWRGQPGPGSQPV